jgi:hypothetical protein
MGLFPGQEAKGTDSGMVAILASGNHAVRAASAWACVIRMNCVTGVSTQSSPFLLQDRTSMKRAANDTSPFIQTGSQQRQDNIQMSATDPPANPQDSSPLSAPCVYSVANEGHKAMPAIDARSLASYMSELAAWTRSATPAEVNLRLAAESRCARATRDNQESSGTIDISSLALKTLPPLPAGLRRLVARDNRLSSLPDYLPQELQTLDVSGNKLSALPENLPQKLEFLLIDDNRLCALPENLPKDLKCLSAAQNRLTTLRDNLPSTLQYLYAAHNRLTTLPELPQGLQDLDISDNQLDALPQLPEGLKHLSVGNNNLASLPGNLPPDLQNLYCRGNDFRTLPDNLPRQLRHLDVGRNRLSSLSNNLPKELQTLIVDQNFLTNTMVLAFMKSNTSITTLVFESPSDSCDDPLSQAIETELSNNRAHPARLIHSAVTLDLLTRFAFTMDQAGTLANSIQTQQPADGSLPAQHVPRELHYVLANNCSKDLLAVLSQMSGGNNDY